MFVHPRQNRVLWAVLGGAALLLLPVLFSAAGVPLCLPGVAAGDNIENPCAAQQAALGALEAENAALRGTISHLETQVASADSTSADSTGAGVTPTSTNTRVPAETATPTDTQTPFSTVTRLPTATLPPTWTPTPTETPTGSSGGLPPLPFSTNTPEGSAGELGATPIQTLCLVTDVGRVNDGTFNQLAYEGMLRAAEDFSLETTFIETQAQADYLNNINTCVNEGYDAIITVGFLIEDATYTAALANPEVYFIGVDQGFFGREIPPNLVGFQYREDQAGFLVGVMAALMTQSGVIGGVYGIDIPPVLRYRNGYEQGARYAAAEMGRDLTLLGVHLDSFVAPDQGASAAEQFIDEGADVIFGVGGPTGSGAILFAAQQGVFVIGVDVDEYFTTFGGGSTPGAEFLITSAQKRVDVGVYDMVGALAGSGADWTGGGIYTLDVANGGISFAPPHDAFDYVDEDVTALVLVTLRRLASGELDTGVDPLTGALLAN